MGIRVFESFHVCERQFVAVILSSSLPSFGALVNLLNVF